MRIWAITSYFNPIRYDSRLYNFCRFRDALSVPLITVELGFHGRFELTASDSDIVVRATATDVLWQKERLLNLALPHVPSHVDCICWLDCDVLLERPDWPRAAMEALRTHQVIQLFSELHDLPRTGLPQDLIEPHQATGLSIAHLMSTGKKTLADLDPTATRVRPREVSWGLAWAARKSLLLEHRFYDAMIVGSGDRAMACAALGRLDNPIALTRMNEHQKTHYLRWAEPFHHAVGGKIGVIDGRIYHLWHGDIENRQYRQRHEAFADFAFNPTSDLVVNESGVYEWARHRRDLAEFCRGYFLSRREDGAAALDANHANEDACVAVAAGR